ncbi:MAG: 4-phosphopantetheinyl transferase [Gemmatimonadetes bacterium]|nr:4-phosphopantetheinyl transferase [Gemmatimonadota bacterium]
MIAAPNESAALGAWCAPPPPSLGDGDVHVWRIPLASLGEGDDRYDALWPLLSHVEQARARRFHFERDRRAFVISHGMTRRIIADYQQVPAGQLVFVDGEFGKPSLVGVTGASALAFNLSHSGGIALLAVSRGRQVGVDVEQWKAEIEHLELADHFFSKSECEALRALAGSPPDLVAGFFAAWSRKEAYLKASGHGITRGLHHFDVTLAPGEDATVIADRMDPSSSSRWMMRAISAAADYSAALVVAEPVRSILLFDADVQP